MSRKRVLGVIGFVVAWCQLASIPAVSWAQSREPLETDVYIPAKSIERAAPRYPGSAAMQGREGWVALSFVVSEQGEVIEPMIEDSSGNEQIERAALDAVRQWRYAPATLNGAPVEDSVTETVIRFMLDGVDPVARGSFRRAYREIEEHIAAQELAAAETLLTDLEYEGRVNLYEDAWFWWLKYRHLAAAGAADEHAMAEALRKAVGYDEPIYLSPDVYVAAVERLYVLEVRELDLGAAIDTFEKLRDSKYAIRSDDHEDSIARLAPSYEAILESISADTILEFKARIGKHGYWVHDLVRRSFSLADIQGPIELLDVRCERGNRRYASIPDGVDWTIPESWGECGVYVKGDEGTTFLFYELPLTAASE